MDAIAKSRCDIKIVSNQNPANVITRSSKSSIELRLDNTGLFLEISEPTIRNTKIVLTQYYIHNIKLYEFGSSPDQPDKIHNKKNEICHLTLARESRQEFHGRLKEFLPREIFNENKTTSTTIDKPPKTGPSVKDQHERNLQEGIAVLLDVQLLNDYIQQGKAENSDKLAKKLAEKKVQLRSTKIDHSHNESPMNIEVQIDSIDQKIEGHGEKHALRVSTSTTVNELRALFNYAFGFPFANQFFFVNGHLAYAQSTMEELKINMSVLAYSSCRIEYTPDDEKLPERAYSERSVIELRQGNDERFSLRAVDVENKRTEIFNVPLKNPHQYQIGGSEVQPDEMEHNNGTYRFWLPSDSGDPFHETLCAVLEALFSENLLNSDVYSDSDIEIPMPVLRNTFEERKTLDPDIPIRSLPLINIPEERKPPAPNQAVCNPKDLLNDIHNLNRFIKQGRVDEVADVINQLIKRGVRLTAQSFEHARNEEEFPISIQLDGNEYGIDQHGGIIPVNVYPSTTIRELRAAFEIAYRFPPTNQYIFVNGKLTQDSWTMKDLHVGPHSLFVLFVLGHAKQFQSKDPWKCTACRTQNSSDDIKCRLCLASRKY